MVLNRLAAIAKQLKMILNRFAATANWLATILNRLAAIVNPLKMILNGFAAAANWFATVLNRFAAIANPLKMILNRFAVAASRSKEPLFGINALMNGKIDMRRKHRKEKLHNNDSGCSKNATPLTNPRLISPVSEDSDITEE